MTYYPRPITTLFSTTRLHFEYGAQSATAELQKYSLSASYPLRQAFSRLCQARSLGNKYKAQQLLASPYRLTAYCNHADGIGCDDCSRLLRVFYELRYQQCPTRILVQVWRPLRFCPHLRLMSRELGRAYQIAVQSKSSPVPALSSCPECD